MQQDQTIKRKSQHLDIALNENVESGLTTGFESFHFKHCALPEINFNEIDTTTTFLGKPIQAPLLISSMTGGTELAFKVNKHLATAAEKRGWVMAVGSTRAGVENQKVAHTFQIRKYAPSIPILTNLGAVQLNLGYGVEEARHSVEMVQADALILHLNGLQEVFQKEGDTDFSDLLKKIEKLCSDIEVPVGVKEVGWGIDGPTAQKLFNAGVSFVDVAGAGGTSWVQVEKYRLEDQVKREAAEAFVDWGIPTAICLQEAVAMNPDKTILASGGLRNGVDVAKALALGASLGGFGRSLLRGAFESSDAVQQVLGRIEFELRTAMFAIGAHTLDELKQTDRLISMI